MEQGKTYIKADCGHFHPEDECEVVIIKLVKGKNCPLESVFENKNITMGTGSAMKIDNSGTANTANINPNIVNNIESLNKVRRNIIPPGIASMFIPEGHPDFEKKGAKEIRRI